MGIAAHGIVSKVSEGLLLEQDEGWNGTSGVRATAFTYRATGAGPYPSPVGYSANPRSDSLSNLYHVPLQQRAITQDGATFTWAASSFDAYARPLAVTRSSSLGFSRSETTAYFDLLPKWVLGQVSSVTESTTGAQQESYSYNASTGTPSAAYRFGLLINSFAYNTDGTLATKFDALNRATGFSSYKRGLPQLVNYPDGSSESAVINALGLITSLTNAAGTTSTFGYDAIGRLASITPPTDSGISYYPTTLSFVPVAAIEYGLPAGHWRQMITAGNAVTVHYFDGFWRPVVTLTYDASNVANTSRVVRMRWDPDGRSAFESYPLRTIAAYDSVVNGKSSVYDALGRQTTVNQDSELGLLTTSVSYLTGFQQRVTNARGYATTTSFFALDSPEGALVSAITAPESANTRITRNVFGHPISITRSGPGPSGTVSAIRSYVYDSAYRLCKTIEPERGATVQAYDAAGNVSWKASGQSLSSTTSCDQSSVAAASKLSFGYDAVDRLNSTTLGDGSPSISRTYTPDGLPYQVNSGPSSWTYGYNNRRVLTSESLALTTTGASYAISWGTDAYGNRNSLTYPGGSVVSYAPDALGEPTQVSGYASAVTYFPNGAVAGYSLSNGIAHSLTETIRGAPLVWRDAGVIQDSYAYNANGGVGSITDQQEGLTSRILGYDGLDRLISASGIWGAGSFGYDGLDNLRTSTVGARTLVHNYDATNRLTSLSGSQNVAYSYDVNGNVAQRGTQLFSFDIGNRITSAPGKASYGYDGDGRRVWVQYADGTWKVQFYSQAGQLLFSKHSTQGETRHVYLGRSLVAEQNSLTGVRYAHTDALGSPVAWTNSLGQLLSRTRYEPYGGTAAGTNPTGIGYTGHVNDADTGLIYMQQRYYDPLAGRFLSVDPLETDPRTGANFGRYSYVANDPLDKTDPSGMNACGGSDDSKCVVTITIADRSKDDAGKYNDKFTGVKSQANYNATATVSVNGKVSGTFLVKTTPSDPSKSATIANGTYSGTLTTHHGGLAIALNQRNDIPTVGPNPSRSDHASLANQILIHAAGRDNFTGVGRDGRAVSEGCQTVCTSQYGTFERAAGMIPSAGPPQRHFGVSIDTDENEP